jgi:hypothetical protein
MDKPKPLIDVVRQMAKQPVRPAVCALADHVRGLFADTAGAILFYGSCLRSGDDRDGIVDLYVLVDSYHRSYDKPIWASLNKLLPPNVYYLEIPFEGRTVRAKYAVLSLADFHRGVSRNWFHSYIWGRFAQPTAVVYARSDAVAERIYQSLARAVRTFVDNVLPQAPTEFSGRDFWYRGLSLSYRAELRAERAEKLVRLCDAAPRYYAEVTAAALEDLAVDGISVEVRQPDRYRARVDATERRRCARQWRVRIFQGKLLSVMRLLKGWATFSGGTDYILWKIKRHTGVEEKLSPHMRRHPLLAVCVIGWRLYRRGGFR